MAQEALIKGEHTSLYALHEAAGGRLVDFAGFLLPVQYPRGILAEHNHTRARASLFDVSHMGQALLHASAEELEKILPSDLIAMRQGQVRYSFLLNENGGIIDDLMITKRADRLWSIVVNAACKAKDYAHLEQHAKLEPCDDLALLALQGPYAKDVMATLNQALATLPFMTTTETEIGGIKTFVARSGYTGEDGYEISVKASSAETLASALLQDERVALAGLGARDTLRLEAGLCLYGQDIDENTTPLEARLGWAISKRRKTEGGFIGAAKIQEQLAHGTARTRIGLTIKEKRPVRQPSLLRAPDGTELGLITSGGIAATQTHPIAMGYIQTPFAKIGAEIIAEQRAKAIPAEITPLPFRKHNYYQK